MREEIRTLRNLEAVCVPISEVGAADLRNLYDLYAAHFDGTSYPSFRKDFWEKDRIILMRNETGEIKGFSTLAVSRTMVGGEEIRVLFSGDTIIDREYWGTQALSRKFFSVTGDIYRQEEKTPLYWFLIVKGHRTYRYLKTFYHRFYPDPEEESEELKKIAYHLAMDRFGNDFDKDAGVLKFDRSQGHLKPDLADIPEKDQRHSNVRYFLDKNPGYRQGHELVCLCSLSPENHRPFARRIFDGKSISVAAE